MVDVETLVLKTEPFLQLEIFGTLTNMKKFCERTFTVTANFSFAEVARLYIQDESVQPIIIPYNNHAKHKFRRIMLANQKHFFDCLVLHNH